MRVSRRVLASFLPAPPPPSPRPLVSSAPRPRLDPSRLPALLQSRSPPSAFVPQLALSDEELRKDPYRDPNPIALLVLTVPALVPTAFVAVTINWASLKLFKHNA